MALVFARVVDGSRPDAGQQLTDITLDGTSYSSGFAVTPAQLGMIRVDGVEVVGQSGASYTSMTTASWDQANLKIRLGKGLVEAVAGDFTTSNKIRVRAHGVPAM